MASPCLGAIMVFHDAPPNHDTAACSIQAEKLLARLTLSVLPVDVLGSTSRNSIMSGTM